MVGDFLNSGPERLGVTNEGHDVLEDNAGFRVIRDIYYSTFIIETRHANTFFTAQGILPLFAHSLEFLSDTTSNKLVSYRVGEAEHS